MKPPTPINISSSTTSRVVGSEHNRLDGGETEVPCGSPRVEANTYEIRPNPTETDDGSVGTSLNVQVDDDDDMIEEPKLGMEFNSIENLMSYYKEYGKKCGFGVMTKWTERGEDDEVRYVTFACARGGKSRNRTLNVANPRPTGKTEYGVLRLTTVHNIYNHDLSPKKSRFFRFNREVSDAVKMVLDTNDLARIRTNKSYGSLVVGAGRFENLPFLEKDCRNYIDKTRHLRLSAGGVGAVLKYLLRMQFKNHGFFYMMDIDDNGSLWYLDDVVTFDTTYLTNQYGKPFAPFVAYLIFSEDTETFVWLFETWLIERSKIIVFPKTRHRFCLWHILKKVPEKLGAYGSYKTGMKNSLMKCVFDSQSVDEFEKSYTLSVNIGTNLKEFIENENLVDFQSFNVTIPCISRSPIEKRFQELYTNAKFKEVQQQVNSIIDLNPKLYKSDGALKTYLIEEEIFLEEFTKLVTHFVDFSEDNAVARCSCGLFEMRGIMCRRILAVFRCNDMKFLPEMYILDRWRKDIRRRYTLIDSSYDAGEQCADSNRYLSLLNICYQMITYSSDSREHTEDVRNKLYAMIELYRANQEHPSMTQIDSNVDSTTKDTIVGASGKVHSPRVVRGKGRPPSLRRASRIEINMRRAKAKMKKAPAKE
ncbi:hypothetical protein CIPAW_09G162400 [Carya illinoinensis]|uniref:Protein FAR1-RELATED SEQUENCE n=1 Tax=Carya illinoinensis TaxID=32201 RepID=A0A8T1PKZ3_CARIL|nr:hypothetical protein CIPAW_09G162400 [Carya illinoinensis]